MANGMRRKTDKELQAIALKSGNPDDRDRARQAKAKLEARARRKNGQ